MNAIEVLKRFDYPLKPGTERELMGYFSNSRFALQIRLKDTENGFELERKNLVPFLRASQDIVWLSHSLWPEDFKEKFNELYRISIAAQFPQKKAS